MRRIVAALIALGLLASCGGRADLRPQQGKSLPVKPETAAQTPQPEDLIAPSTQARPARSDEQLKRSEERRDDPFDLPPER